MIWKDIWFVEPSDDLPPMKWKVIAIDIYGKIITEYDELEWEVFRDDILDNIHFVEPVDEKRNNNRLKKI